MFNERTEDGIEVEVKTFSNHKDFFESLHKGVDLCLIDIDLGIEAYDGFDVGRKVHKLFPKVNFIFSSGDIDEDEDCDTFISKLAKKNFASEVVAKFLHIKDNVLLNFAELLFRQDHYRCHAR